MSLAKRLLNNPGLNALTVPDEMKEVKAALSGQRVILKRSFNQTIGAVTLRFWRVMGPKGHPNYHSDLTRDGLQSWGIIQ